MRVVSCLARPAMSRRTVSICRYMCARTFCVWEDAKPSSKKEKEKEGCVCLVCLCVVLVARESKKLTDSCGI